MKTAHEFGTVALLKRPFWPQRKPRIAFKDGLWYIKRAGTSDALCIDAWVWCRRMNFPPIDVRVVRA